MLMDREDTCHRTCFSLQLDGNVLDNFAELKSIEGLQEGSLLKVVEGQSLKPSSSVGLCKINLKVTSGRCLCCAAFILQSPTLCVRPASTCVTSETF